jgi:hypothetical protein
MSPLAVGLLLAVIASLALNASYLLQHLGGTAAPPVDVRRPWTTLRGLLGSRLWITGTAVGTAGSLLHAGALSRAPLSLVQAFTAAGLAVLVPVAARLTRSSLRPAERAGVAAIVAALVALAAHPVAGEATAVPRVALPLAAAAFAAATAVAGRRQPVVLGLATGILYGIADTSIKAFSDLLGQGVTTAILSPWPLVFATACGIAFFAFQRALQMGRAVTVVAVMTGALNVTAVGAGLAFFGERLGTTTGVVWLHAAAMAAVGVATWWLVRAQARLGSALPVA